MPFITPLQPLFTTTMENLTNSQRGRSTQMLQRQITVYSDSHKTVEIPFEQLTIPYMSIQFLELLNEQSEIIEDLTRGILFMRDLYAQAMFKRGQELTAATFDSSGKMLQLLTRAAKLTTGAAILPPPVSGIRKFINIATAAAKSPFRLMNHAYTAIFGPRIIAVPNACQLTFICGTGGSDLIVYNQRMSELKLKQTEVLDRSSAIMKHLVECGIGGPSPVDVIQAENEDLKRKVQELERQVEAEKLKCKLVDTSCTQLDITTLPSNSVKMNMCEDFQLAYDNKPEASPEMLAIFTGLKGDRDGVIDVGAVVASIGKYLEVAQREFTDAFGLKAQEFGKILAEKDDLAKKVVDLTQKETDLKNDLKQSTAMGLKFTNDLNAANASLKNLEGVNTKLAQENNDLKKQLAKLETDFKQYQVKANSEIADLKTAVGRTKDAGVKLAALRYSEGYEAGYMELAKVSSYNPKIGDDPVYDKYVVNRSAAKTPTTTTVTTTTVPPPTVTTPITPITTTTTTVTTPSPVVTTPKTPKTSKTTTVTAKPAPVFVNEIFHSKKLRQELLDKATLAGKGMDRDTIFKGMYWYEVINMLNDEYHCNYTY